MIERKHKRQRTGGQSVKKWGIIVAVLLVVGTSAYLFRKPLAVMAFDLFLSGKVEQTLEKSYSPIEGEETKPVQEEKQQKLEPFAALLLGIDQRDSEAARSDTMIYAVVRPEDAKVLLVSIPRDTYTEIVGRDREDKINHAYAFGGEKMAKETVEHLLGASVDYYAAINFDGVKEIVDALGGIELPITKDIVNKQADHEKFTIKANKPIYDGQEALNFVRYREDGGYNRNMRHQVFLHAMADRMLSLDQVTKIPELINMMGANFKTDLPPTQIIELSKNLLLVGQSPQISGFTITGKGTRINGIYYDKVNEEELKFAQTMIEDWLNPDTEPANLITPESRDAKQAESESAATGKDSVASANGQSRR
ncbi:LCP family protein [Paenibacillus sanguinis]|uniref:LCP family protein n=1 Tax=Paenibacillus sanguinis TaxID=225906 RepID=UPI00037D717B|nr:LCP family protein [Paenibacillus sanguinis]